MVNRSEFVMVGPLVPWAEGFAAELGRLGYQKGTATLLMRLVRRLSGWLEGHGLGSADLSAEVVDAFLNDVRADGGSLQPTGKTLAGLLRYLREMGAVPPPSPPLLTPLEALVEPYRHYLEGERGLTAGAVETYVRTAKLFLTEQSAHGELDLAGLTAAEVTAFMTRQFGRGSVGSAKLQATTLRAWLHFAHLVGLTSRPLAGAVPSAAGWSGGALPKALEPGAAGQLLASCDRNSATGLRDHAILTVLLRLGLRAGEVAALTLDDLDWRAGELMVHGKGRGEARLPLPADVGEEIVAYLRGGRPRRPERALFLRVHAPLHGLSAEGVAEVVRAASARARLGSFGPHRLRHTAATEMLRQGASLAEIGQVLRHRSAATTAIYAKLDHRSLRALALPWPGCGL
ncbi:MAG: tyrosine-type recombinase/integrase [Candidatus Dormibacteria bacterium]